ncbi:hypothetical protein PENSPDRAFT_655263 [Peniophora sp. CONT]|nr:hypothetical protein PENSPDRAFT_655263 [Peniophora sp. CONT]
MLENDFPFLEDFNLYALSLAVDGWSEALTVLSKTAPRLQCLRLVVPGISYPNMNWGISGFSALKRLDLECSNSLPDTFLPHLLDVLRRIPLLAELCLSGSAQAYTASDCTERCISSTTNEIRIIDLTQLRELKIKQALESYTHFLRHVRIPGAAHVVIDNVYTSDLFDIQTMCAHLSSCMVPPLDQQPPFISATVKFIQGFRNWFVSNPDKLELWLRREVDTGPVDPLSWFRDRTGRPNQLRLSLLHNMFPALTPIIDRSITTLTLDGHTEIENPWPVILAFESVETLHLLCQSHQFSQPTGLEALLFKEGRLPFPKLRHLTLMKYFMPDIVYDLPTHLVRQPRTLLEEVIHERRAHGSALHTIDVPMRETIQKVKAGEWNSTPDIENLLAAVARIQELSEVHIVEEHPFGLGFY